jgi:ABC-type transport system involved in multi-copper enzyme maturation permease subunit
MNPLVKKEIRLLLPSWIVALALVALLPWFWTDPDASFAWTPFLVFFGMIILAVDSLGRECNIGTFQLLLSQPVERLQIWRTKIMVLFSAAVLVFAAYYATCGLRLHLAITDSHSIWHINPKLIVHDFSNAMFASGAVLFVALTGGLWTTLLLRQVAAAFWITLLTPVGLFFLVALVMSKLFSSASDGVVFAVLYGAAGVYSLFGFLLAHRLFHRAQDAAWTGGIIDFSRWRYFESGTQSTNSVRCQRPVAALLKKEFQLHSVSLICTGALLALHIAVILMRKVHGHFEPRSMLGTVSEFYWSLWLVMPLIIGCTVAAEEQRLGVMEGQSCLPASRRLQFTLKFVPAIVSGLLLGGFMPLLLEGIAGFFGAPNPDFRFFNRADGFGYVSPITVVSFALALSLAGCFASTFTKNSLQAMGIAILTLIGCGMFTFSAANLQSFLGITWNPGLTIDIAILSALVIFPSLTYRNFKYFQERGRMWRRNVWGLPGKFLNPWNRRMARRYFRWRIRRSFSTRLVTICCCDCRMAGCGLILWIITGLEIQRTAGLRGCGGP